METLGKQIVWRSAARGSQEKPLSLITGNEAREQQKGLLLAGLIHLVKDCPVDGCNPKDCPLHKVRKMKMPMRLKWFKALSEDDLIYLATYHHVCINTKLAAPAKPENFT